jgi:hypothetical protein
MNTKNKQDQKKNQSQEARQQQRPKKQGPNPGMFQEHEHPETRMTR